MSTRSPHRWVSSVRKAIEARVRPPYARRHWAPSASAAATIGRIGGVPLPPATKRPKSALDLFKAIPFLNGGLFECLDKDLGENAKPRYVRIDGFSRREDSQPVVPDFLDRK